MSTALGWDARRVKFLSVIKCVQYAESIITFYLWVSGPTFLLSAVTVKQLTRQLTDYSLGKDFRWDC